MLRALLSFTAVSVIARRSSRASPMRAKPVQVSAPELLSANVSDADVVPCCPPFGPTPPAPFPANYETRWFTQPRDHFNYFSPLDTNATFEQRFLYDARHWAGPPAPIIFVTCVEAGPAPYYYGEYGWVVDTLAANLSALVVFAEHRGFGLTYPAVADGGDLSGWIPDAAHAGVLTEAQVLEDDTALATSLRRNLSAWDSPLIAIGGSLAGEMAAWWRIRYPFTVDMALSASAPIFGFPGLTSEGAPLCDEFAWEAVVANAFRIVGGDECVSHFRDGYWQTAALSPAAVTTAFNTCTPATLPCHAQQIADMAIYWTETAAELGSYPSSNPKRSQTAWACGMMAGSTTGVDAYVKLMAPMVPGQCLNVSWDGQCSAVGARTPGWCTSRWNDTSSGCQDGWGIESCTTEIHPISSNNVRRPRSPFYHPSQSRSANTLTPHTPTNPHSTQVTDFFPPSTPFSEAERQQGCRAQYGSNLRVDGGAMPRSFGQIDLARMAQSSSRIIFSSGEFDPWSSMSVKTTLSPTLPYVWIKGGAHHSDIGNNWNPIPTPDDEPALREARELEMATLTKWVADFHVEREASKKFIAGKKN